MKFIILTVICCTFILPDTAQAGYLDPGTGSTLVQGIVAMVASISRFFRKLFCRGK